MRIALIVLTVALSSNAIAYPDECAKQVNAIVDLERLYMYSGSHADLDRAIATIGWLQNNCGIDGGKMAHNLDAVRSSYVRAHQQNTTPDGAVTCLDMGGGMTICNPN